MVDGHSHQDLLEVFSTIRERVSEKPLAIIANTIKGKGVSYMEGQIKWHHGVPNDEEYQIAMKELSSI